ncbi:aminotransferase class I/II-fold pyridoxal phosphate-dependent enzyme [Cryomorpha ignava]|uniref:GDP-perosamine synthase n=1 Tax=Cryomorpha ignava TaxID=101383 RepID=A0A7K3WPK7_9FLAO|nr:aminotransferase class I/II-fold pyridoxal phosphate-dependent enzyme [Cryomorpha ignava]NEN23434.1 aminotransferase class I/II-fold pyridoxal phosphate-dependent enzyme [Cryomorpha ignava]
MEIRDFSIGGDATIRSAMEVLNKTLMGIGFVVDGDGKLTGTVTDGDIRRALLKGHTISDEVGVAMNRNFVSLPMATSNVDILKVLSDKVKVIPLVSESGVLKDYASIRKIRRISVAAPSLGGNELAYVTDCIRTNWISSQGKYVREFEAKFSEYHDGYKALAVSNGTVALHLALVALGIGEGDEVIVPDLTFAASINAILYTGATPVLADVDADSWNIDPEVIERLITPRTKAIMPVHLYGQPCDMQPIIEIAGAHNLLIVEDAAEALGSLYQSRPVGTFGDVATFSFFGNKTITTGEGGMVIFRDEAAYERAAVLRDHGMSKTKRYWHNEVGFNYRLTNLQAAIGVAQMERMDEFVDAKRRIAGLYNEELTKSAHFVLPLGEEVGSKNSYWLYTFLVKADSPFSRDELIAFLAANGIESRPVFYPLHEMPPYTQYGKASELSRSIAISKTGISLPSSPILEKEEVKFICERILYYAAHYKNS